jgi:TolB-like protein
VVKRPLVIAIALATMAGAAWAKPKVVIVPFEGDPGGDAQDGVADALGDDVKIAPPKETTRAIDKLGLDTEMSDKDLKKLSNELEADAVIRGSLSSKDGKQVLHFKLFVKGKKVKGFTVEYGSLKSDKVKTAIHDKLIEKLAPPEPEEDKPKHKDADADADADADTKPKKKDKDKDKDEDADADVKPKKHKRVAKGDDDEEVEEEVTTVKVAAHSANRDAIRVDFGISAMARTLTFNSRNFEQAPKGYKNSPVPGGRVDGELYPFAFGNANSAAAGIGIAGEFDQTFALNLQSTAQPGTKFPVTERHWSIGARYRIAFGSKPTSPTLTVGGGFAHHTFVVNRSALAMGTVIDLPDVDYVGFDPGLTFRIPIGGVVALMFGGRALLVTGTGAIQTPAQYGQAKVTAGEASAGLDFVFSNRYALRIVAEFAQMGFAFTGGAEMTNNRDGEPNSKDVGGAADRYLGGALTFGVLY